MSQNFCGNLSAPKSYEKNELWFLPSIPWRIKLRSSVYVWRSCTQGRERKKIPFYFLTPAKASKLLFIKIHLYIINHPFKIISKFEKHLKPYHLLFVTFKSANQGAAEHKGAVSWCQGFRQLLHFLDFYTYQTSKDTAKYLYY